MICRYFLICDICDIYNYITLNVELWVYSIHMSQNELKFHQWRHIKSTLVNRCSMLWLLMIYVITILWMIYGFSWITPFSSPVGWFDDALLEWTSHVWNQPAMKIIAESLQAWSWTIIHGKFFSFLTLSKRTTAKMMETPVLFAMGKSIVVSWYDANNYCDKIMNNCHQIHRITNGC